MVDSYPEVDSWRGSHKENLTLFLRASCGRLKGDFRKSDAYASLLQFSHQSQVFRASAQFSALDGQQLLVVEGSGWRGRRESDSQVFCHSNSVHASAFHG